MKQGSQCSFCHILDLNKYQRSEYFKKHTKYYGHLKKRTASVFGQNFTLEIFRGCPKFQKGPGAMEELFKQKLFPGSRNTLPHLAYLLRLVEKQWKKSYTILCLGTCLGLAEGKLAQDVFSLLFICQRSRSWVIQLMFIFFQLLK